MRSGPEQHTIAYLQQLGEQRASAAGKTPIKPVYLLLLIPVALIVVFLFPPLMPLLIIGGVIYAGTGKKKTGGNHEERPRWEREKEREEDTVFQVTSAPPASEPYDEDGTVWLSKEKRLEQLKTLKDAGIMDQEEYLQRKKRIQSGQ